MASSKQIETSLLTEHFRYTPLSLIDHIINAINELINHAVDAVERGLNDAPPAVLGFVARAEAENTIPDTDGDGNLLFPEMRAEIEEGVHQLETLLESTVDKNFDKLEIYLLRNVLTVPEDLVPWVKLAHYENLDFSTSPTKPTPTPESVQALRRKVHETNKLHTALLTEKVRNDALLTQLRSLLGQGPQPKVEPASSPAADDPSRAPSAQHPSFDFLANTPAAQALGVSLQAAPQTQSSSNNNIAAAATPLQTNTAFTLSQLPALRRLLESLRPKIAVLSAAKTGPEVAENETARARRDYVEAQTRRLLEKRGVDVRGGGGGDGDDLGRRVGQDEIRGIEAVAEMLGRPAEERVKKAAEADHMDVS